MVIWSGDQPLDDCAMMLFRAAAAAECECEWDAGERGRVDEAEGDE